MSACPQYAPVVADWIFHQWVAEQDPDGYHQVLTKVLASAGTEPTPFMILLLNGDTAIGTAEVKPHQEADAGDAELWLDGVYVLPQYRGHGLAGQLVQQAMQQAKKVGVARLFLHTRHLDGGLYVNAGFKPLQQIVYRDQPVLEMVAEIF